MKGLMKMAAAELLEMLIELDLILEA